MFIIHECVAISKNVMSDSQNEQREKYSYSFFMRIFSKLQSVLVEKPLLDHIKFAQPSFCVPSGCVCNIVSLSIYFCSFASPIFFPFLYQGLQHSDIKKKNYRTTCLQIVLDFVFVCARKEKSKG